MTTTQKRKFAEAELEEQFGGKNKRLPFIGERVNIRLCCKSDKSINTEKYFEYIQEMNENRDWYSGMFWTTGGKVSLQIQTLLKVLNRDYVGLRSSSLPPFELDKRVAPGEPTQYTILKCKNQRDIGEIDLPLRYNDMNPKNKYNKLWNKTWLHQGRFTTMYERLQTFLEQNAMLSDKNGRILENLVQKNLRIKGIIFKFYNILKRNIKTKSINELTLHLEELSEVPNTVKISTGDMHKYFTFSLPIISNIIAQALLKANPGNKLKPRPDWPTNPYTRKYFTERELYVVYCNLLEKRVQIPLVFKMFMDCSMNMNKFKTINKAYLEEIVSLQYVSELDPILLENYVMDYVITYNNRTYYRSSRNFSNFRYCTTCVKKLLRTNRDAFTRLIRDYIYHDNGMIKIRAWIGSQALFQSLNKNLNNKTLEHTKCMILDTPKPTGNPFISRTFRSCTSCASLRTTPTRRRYYTREGGDSIPPPPTDVSDDVVTSSIPRSYYLEPSFEPTYSEDDEEIDIGEEDFDEGSETVTEEYESENEDSVEIEINNIPTTPFTYIETRTENSSGSEIRVVLRYSSREDPVSVVQDERDIGLVMDQARVNREEAQTALTNANGDIVNAIMSLE